MLRRALLALALVVALLGTGTAVTPAEAPTTTAVASPERPSTPPASVARDRPPPAGTGAPAGHHAPTDARRPPSAGPLAPAGPPPVEGPPAPPGTPGPAGTPGSAAPPSVPGASRDPSDRATGSHAAIVAVYPNPVTDEDRGEFVVVRLPGRASTRNWTLADGESVARVPDGVAGRPVALSTAPALAGNLTGWPVARLDGRLSLANGGDSVALRTGNRTVDAVRYSDAPEAEVWTPAGWNPLGATDFRPGVVRDTPVRAFALPDDPGVPVDVLESADRRILLAGYTFASARVAGLLRSAAGRGVRVRVLLDGGPVGGMTRREARLLDGLVRAGVEVRVLDGPRTRYAFHHPKYAVVDDRALVASENWKPAGIGGHDSRGWGVVVRSHTLAAHLARVFRADAGWRAATPWRSYRANASFEPGAAANGSFPTRFPARRLRVDRARLLVAPDNAEREVLGLVRSADRSLVVEQVSIEPTSPFLRATVAAARRGVRVRVLVGSAWYVREENRRLVRRLNDLADAEGLPLAARLVEPRSRFGKVHVKGVVVDRRRVLVGSLNWNNHSARQNREVAVVLVGDAAGRYYHRLFLADWRGAAWRVPAGVLVAAGLAAAAALWLARRRIRFAREP